MNKEALKLALEALTYIYTETTADEDELIDQAITAIKEALAHTNVDADDTSLERVDKTDENVHEPVAWEQFYPDIGKLQLTHPPQGIYYTPPQRTWVGLSDEERQEIALEVRIDAYS